VSAGQATGELAVDGSHGKLFHRLVQQAVAVDPAPYESLVKYALFPL
jgi:hypothetical protein